MKISGLAKRYEKKELAIWFTKKVERSRFIDDSEENPRASSAGHLDVGDAEGRGSKSHLMSFFESKRRFICLLHFCLLLGKKVEQHRSLAQVAFGFKQSPEPDDIGLNDPLHHALHEFKQVWRLTRRIACLLFRAGTHVPLSKGGAYNRVS